MVTARPLCRRGGSNSGSLRVSARNLSVNRANRRANGESYIAGGVVSRDDESVLMQWARDSAFRFFPLVENDLLGLVLHPFDLATNKVLALAGRLEAHDWIDVLNCHEYIQPLGYLVWAACGKDPGFSPASLLAAARRSRRIALENRSITFHAGTIRGVWPQVKGAGHEW